MDLLEMIEQITRNAVAQREQLERWEREMGLAPVKKREPTELELLLQEWEQASGAPQPPEPEGEEPPLPEPRGEELLLPEPRGEELPLPEPREEVTSVPPPQPRPPPLRSSPASLRPVPHPLLLDTLSVSLDLPSLDLEPRSRQDRAQFSTWSPAPLLPDTKTSLRCSQTSRTLPLVTTSLPLADWTSLHWVPAADLCPLLQPPVPRLSCRSPLTNRWGPSSPVRGPYLADPGRGPIHPRVRPWKRAKIDIYGLEAADLCPLLQPPVPRLSCRSPLTNRWGPSSPVLGPYLADPGRGPIHPRVRPWKRAKIDIYGLEGKRLSRPAG
ncbi:UNVERIFIED_CONTAM: hypothetical protein FKN15_056369 [Acipenser sinensis]